METARSRSLGVRAFWLGQPRLNRQQLAKVFAVERHGRLRAFNRHVAECNVHGIFRWCWSLLIERPGTGRFPRRSSWEAPEVEKDHEEAITFRWACRSACEFERGIGPRSAFTGQDERADRTAEHNARQTACCDRSRSCDGCGGCPA